MIDNKFSSWVELVTDELMISLAIRTEINIFQVQGKLNSD